MRVCALGRGQPALRVLDASSKRCRITQSTCSGGLGGISRCSMKPGKVAIDVLVSPCQRANSSARSGRTQVWVTMLTLTSARYWRAAWAEQPVGREGQVGEAHAGRVGERVGHRRRHRIDAAFALGLGAQRADRVDRVGEEDVGVRRVGEGRNAAVAQLRVHHVALVMDHVLDQRPAVAHGDGAIELAAALHRIDRPADVGGMHAVQDADLAGDRDARRAARPAR